MTHVDLKSGVVRATYISADALPVYLRERIKIRPFGDVWTALAEATAKLLARVEQAK